jgi:F0F1-type ATP synthase epsilon subunit
MAQSFSLLILDRNSELYRGTVISLSAEFGLGRAEILAGHAPFAALTKPGGIKLCDEQGKTVSLDLPSPGFFHILNNRAVIIL